MTIKQISLLTFVAIATQMHGSQGPAQKPHATRTVQKPTQSAKRTSQQPTLPQQPTVTIINGPFINYGTAHIGTVNRAPQFGQPGQAVKIQQQKQQGYSLINVFNDAKRLEELQKIEQDRLSGLFREAAIHNQRIAQQQEFLRNKAEEDKKMQESQKVAYVRLQELSAVSDLLPKKQANQLNNLMKCKKEEGYVLAEDILNRLNETPEVQDIKPFIGLLKYADTLEFSTPPTQKTTYDPVSRPVVPKNFLLGQPTLQYNTTEMPAKPICMQLGLTVKQGDAWNKILNS